MWTSTLMKMVSKSYYKNFKSHLKMFMFHFKKSLLFLNKICIFYYNSQSETSRVGLSSKGFWFFPVLEDFRVLIRPQKFFKILELNDFYKNGNGI